MAEDDVTLKCGLRGLNVGGGILIQVSYSPVINREAPLFQPSDHSLYQSAWAQMDIAPARPGMKWCPDCGDWRPHSYFDADPSRGDGLRGYCREHQRERDHARYVKRTEGRRRDERRSRANVRGRNRK